MKINTIDVWHQVLVTGDKKLLSTLIAENAIFHSPIVHKPQVGKAVTMMYLSAAFKVFYNETFHYVRKLVTERDAVLEFQVEIDGISVNGVDMMTWDEDGHIIDFKVMIRPLKAINLIQQKMFAMLNS
ncbi:MAG: hypothetical protein RIS64_1613 [Bacteroidota bacterium]|jgi:hypothetical protein